MDDSARVPGELCLIDCFAHRGTAEDEFLIPDEKCVVSTQATCMFVMIIKLGLDMNPCPWKSV